MQIEIDTAKVITGVATSIIISILIYIGSTVYELDKHSEILEYRMEILDQKIEAFNKVAQDLYETKADKFRKLSPN
jgi:mannosyltransferase OCH1-like enzyme